MLCICYYNLLYNITECDFRAWLSLTCLGVLRWILLLIAKCTSSLASNRFQCLFAIISRLENICSHTNMLSKTQINNVRRSPGIEYEILIFCIRIPQGSYHSLTLYICSQCHFAVWWVSSSMNFRNIFNFCMKKVPNHFFENYINLLSVSESINSKFIFLTIPDDCLCHANFYSNISSLIIFEKRLKSLKWQKVSISNLIYPQISLALKCTHSKIILIL